MNSRCTTTFSRKEERGGGDPSLRSDDGGRGKDARQTPSVCALLRKLDASTADGPRLTVGRSFWALDIRRLRSPHAPMADICAAVPRLRHGHNRLKSGDVLTAALPDHSRRFGRYGGHRRPVRAQGLIQLWASRLAFLKYRDE